MTVSSLVKSLLVLLLLIARARVTFARWLPTLIVLVGCSRTPTPPPAPPTPAIAAPRSLSSFTFSPASLKSRATRFDSAASTVYPSGWTKRPLTRDPASPQYQPAYRARWELLRTDDVDVDHNIELTLHSTPHLFDQIQAVRVTARYFPDRGWGAIVDYGVVPGAAQPQGFFGMRFANMSQSRRRDSIPDFVLDVPNRDCAAAIREGNCSYDFAVVPETPVFQSISSVDEQVVACLASAERLREFVLEELRAMEAKVRKDVPSGAACVGVVDWSYVRSDHPPQSRPPPPGASLTAELKAQALGALLAEIERRRGLIQGHYQAMFESAHRAIPLYECICSGAQCEQDSSWSQNPRQPD